MPISNKKISFIFYIYQYSISIETFIKLTEEMCTGCDEAYLICEQERRGWCTWYD